MKRIFFILAKNIKYFFFIKTLIIMYEKSFFSFNFIKFTNLLILFFLAPWSFAQKYTPIPAKKEPVKDVYFGKVISDEYRWLENVSGENTKSWVQAQTKMSKKYLKKVRFLTDSYLNIEKYRNPKFSYGIKKGPYYFSLFYPSIFESASLYFRRDIKKEADKLLDPSELSNKEGVNIDYIEISKDYKYLAVLYSHLGTDWEEIKIISLPSGKVLKDHIKGVKFSNIAWTNDGFFYGTYEQKSKFGQTLNNKVFFHKLGTSQSEDQLIIARKNDPFANFDFMTTSDGRFLLLEEMNEKKGYTNIYYIDFHSNIKTIRPLFFKLKKNIDIIDNMNEDFLARFYEEDNNGMIFKFNLKNPKKWQMLAPAYQEAVLVKVIPFTDRFIAIYQSNQQPILTVIDYNGNPLYRVAFPYGSSIGGFNAEKQDKEMLFYMQSYTVPKVVYKFNIETFEKKLINKTGVSFNYKDIVYQNIEYPSKDGTMVPMLLVYKKGIKYDGNNPVLLKTYGGFGEIAYPSYDPGIVYFLQKGGVFAYANVRGGGDKGVNWALAGKGLNKQNTIDDFIAGAEYLIKEKITNPEKLAITGASNGGLIVAASAIQRPDLYKAVVPEVAPLDMLRFEKFTVGNFHVDEYGSVKDSLGFYNLLGYSPYHNIKNDINYPAMLVVTSKNDDRVPPFHSYKFVAKMQNRKAQKNPVLLKVEKKSGHMGPNNYSSELKYKADIYGFIIYQLFKSR